MSEQPIDRIESDILWRQLQDKWQADGGYWFPLKSNLPTFEVMAFHTDYFDQARLQKLREILKIHGVQTIFELREGRHRELVIDIDSFEPYYGGHEGFWVDLDLDWVVYASHESSITLAGDWLIKAFRHADPGCELLQYVGPFSTLDLRGTMDPFSTCR